jgi:DNA (cytosine-5)-methyltransferase 1
MLESKRLVVTSSALTTGWINLRPCGQAFFPADAFAVSNGQVRQGRPVRLYPADSDPVETDLPTTRCGTPRWCFRDRRWFKHFAAKHGLTVGSTILISRISEREYRIEPHAAAFTFVDLFAGIGGFRLALQALGGQCAFSCEWDNHAQDTYEANFGDRPAGDIRLIDAQSIPDHDILTAGFPCQPFSIAGVSKKNALGQQHGFRDETQGTLFFEVARILAAKRPQAFILENVKHLLRHDRGHTFSVILRTLTEELGYHVQYQVIDASLVVPQHRERVFIVGTRQACGFGFPAPEEIARRRRFASLGALLEPSPPAKYTLTDHLWNYLQAYAAKHKAAGNGFGFGLNGPNDITRTLSARYYKDGSEILIRQRGRNPRRLTPRECARLMGFPDTFKIVSSDTQAYKQFGNAVVVPVVEAIAEKLVLSLGMIPAKHSEQMTGGTEDR